MDVDELLIDLMCEDNEDACIAFRERYMALIRYWLKSYDNVISYLRLDDEDFVSDIYMCILNSISSYNGSTGSFYCYAKKCMINYLLTYLKKFNSDSRKTLFTSLSIDVPIDDVHTFEDLVQCDYSIADVSRRYEARESIDGMLSVVSSFDHDEKRIAYLRYIGYKPKKIEQRLELSERQIEYKTSNIKKKLTSCIKT